MANLDPLALRVVARFVGRSASGRPDGGGVDPELRLRHIERLMRALTKRIGDDPQHLSVVDLVAALAEIVNEAKTRP
jgi:hypothetical protein